VLLERPIAAQSQKFQIFFQKRFGGILFMVNIILKGFFIPEISEGIKNHESLVQL